MNPRLVLRAMVAVGLVAVSCAAAVVDREVHLTIDGATVVEREELRVALVSRDDVVRWREYRVEMDQHIRLDELTVRVLDDRGRELMTLPKTTYLREESVGFGLYTSRWNQVVPLDGMRVGQQLEIRVIRTADLPYPAMTVALGLPSRQEQLKVEVSGDARLQWRLVGDTDLFDHQGSPVGDLTIRSLSPVPTGTAAALQLGWHPSPSWSSVASWYGELVEQVPVSEESLVGVARRVCDGAASPRECLERLARFVSRSVRYEAVSIGSGGWIPSPPQQVLERHWGDCKDSSMLLHALLGAVGIPSSLVLTNAGDGSRVDPEFPAPHQFNHCIVAVPAAALATQAGDPIADGFLFYDPTVARGGLQWLNPAVRQRWALVVSAGKLVQLPRLDQSEGWSLGVTGRVDEDGSFDGQARLEVTGRQAVRWLDASERRPASQRIARARATLAGFLPFASRLEQSSWLARDESVPWLELTAKLHVPALVRRDRRGENWIPSRAMVAGQRLSEALEDRSGGSFQVQWEIVHHVECIVEAPRFEASTAGGKVLFEADSTPRLGTTITLTLDLVAKRRSPTELTRRELELAVLRASRQRLMLQCELPVGEAVDSTP